MIIDQYTRLYGVMGYPIGHSLSPVMHNAAFLEGGLNAVYLAFESKDVEGGLQGMRALGIRGMSITIPHKSGVVPFLDELDGLSKNIGAVNTIVNNDGRLVGYNTDAMGALIALNDKVDLLNKRCVIIGAGGAARAIGFILKEYGVEVSIANRTIERGKALANALGCPFVPLKEVGVVDVDLLVQTTPVGMHPDHNQYIVSPDLLKQGMVVMDIIYNPLETSLLKVARAKGCLTINGLEMFVHQGAEQFRLWTGLDAPIDAMTLAVKKALRKGHDRD
jgi:shikimate dehydrogenase